MGRILSNTYYKSIELYDGGSIEPVPHSGSGENLGPVPGGLEKDVVLLIVVELDVRELAVLRGQEVEHVEGRLPVRRGARGEQKGVGEMRQGHLGKGYV
jgi:hypothetical protein